MAAVTICDVGPRDGLQNEATVLAPGARADLCNRLAAAGLRRVEAVSFVRGDRVPQMDGAEEVVEGLDKHDGTVFSGLVLNEQGYDRLAGSKLPEAHLALAATESMSKNNANQTVDEAVDFCKAILKRARHDGIRATVTISVAFGCPFEGKVDPGRVADIAQRLKKADEIVLADSIGVATPRAVRKLVKRTKAQGVHLHDTRGTAIANVVAALDEGATVFDSSIGGLGGCPFAPGASGNLATEDLIYLLDGEKVETGIELDTLLEISRWLEGEVGHELPSRVYRARARGAEGASGDGATVPKHP
jgi:hydroxymethylglutaryl-CoA lyase/(R)-citramalyl-CoA lyase